MSYPIYTPNGLPYHQTAGQTYPTAISPYAYAPHTAAPPGGSTQRQASSIQYTPYATSPPGGLTYRPQSTGKYRTCKSTENGWDINETTYAARDECRDVGETTHAACSVKSWRYHFLLKKLQANWPSNLTPSTRSTGSATSSRPAQVLPSQPASQATAGKDEEQEGYIVVKRVPEDNNPRTVGHPASGDPMPCLVTDLPSEFKTMFNMVIHLPGDKCKTRVAKLDTGSSVDVLSQSVVDALEMELESYYGPPIAPVGTALHRPIGQLRLEWHVMGKKKTYITNFLVLDRDSTRGFDALLSETTISDVGFYTAANDVLSALPSTAPNPLEIAASGLFMIFMRL
ncbi:hypothetical protein G7Y79_00023g053730 [Physcia stellaris]|nr:hypothetical protein G7Y79_00023g053730 [Physcia stellaris]